MSKHSEDSFNVLERLTQLLQIHGNMTVYDLAKHSGIPRGTIQSWYDRNNYPPIDKLEIICKALDITLAEFFYEEEYIGQNDEEITIEDKLLINRWHRLSSENKTLIYNMVKALLKGNSQE